MSCVCRSWHILAENRKIWSIALQRYFDSLSDKIKKYTKRVLKYERRLQRTRDGFRGFIRNMGYPPEKKRETNRDPKYQFMIAVCWFCSSQHEQHKHPNTFFVLFRCFEPHFSLFDEHKSIGQYCLCNTWYKENQIVVEKWGDQFNRKWKGICETRENNKEFFFKLSFSTFWVKSYNNWRERKLTLSK